MSYFPGLQIPARPVQRSVFVSYHHDGDQWYKNLLTQLYSTQFPIIEDNSLERALDSDDSEYVMRRIREQYITGTSCTVVLCGAQTRWRKYVDWEIKATLDKCHGLIGVNLPDNPRDANGLYHKPDRLQDNIDSGFALWVPWTDFVSTPSSARQIIEDAIGRPISRIVNSREMRTRNG